MQATHSITGTPLVLRCCDAVEYQDNHTVSKLLVHHRAICMKVFAFAQGQKLSCHKSPGLIFIQVVDGTAHVNVEGAEYIVHQCETLVIPPCSLHALEARTPFKLLLTVLTEEKQVG